MINKSKQIILGIETSCDETSAAIIKAKSYLSAPSSRPRGKLPAISFKILSNIVLSQINIHKKYGGVVPEVAARNHIVNIMPVIDQAITEAKISPKRIDLIAVTIGPGLITSLMIGVQTAKTLAYAWNKPLTGVNHLKAHVYAAWLQATSYKLPAISFPVLALVVSGGHTELILMKNEKSFKKIGQTLDDAAGEAFDKVAKILNLGYPGGPAVSRIAEKGNNTAFKLPRPMMDSPDFNFSFSGLKTAVLYTVQKLPAISYQLQADMAASFQQAAVDVLVAKTITAAQKYKVKNIILGGGVAANKLLRETMQKKSALNKIPLIIPDIKLCTDNAAPIAVAGYFAKPMPWSKIKVDPQLEVEN